VLEQLLVETCPNLRVLDGTVRQISLGKSTMKRVESIMIRHKDGTTEELDNPSLVIGV
jgi:hypothetical protein